MKLPPVEDESENLIPNLTPVIDVMVLLLIFFVGVSQFANKEREVDTQLPQVVEARPLASGNKQIIVNVNQKGEFKVTGEPYSLEQLAAMLQQETFKNPEMQSVQIRADERVAFRFPAQVMGLCEQHNIKHTCAVDIADDGAVTSGGNP